MKNILYAIFVTIFLFPVTLSAQTATPPNAQQKGSLTSGTIESQFRHVNTISRNMDDFKLVRRTNLEKLRANVADSLEAFQKQLTAINQRLSNEKRRTDSLQAGTEKVQAERDDALSSKDNFSVLGMPIHKTTYSFIMWSLVVLLTLALVFFIYRFRQSHVLTADTRKALEEVQQEFDKHRKRAMEREQKLNRQLVDEMNKRQG